MILCNMPNLNYAFAIKARTGRGKEKAKASEIVSQSAGFIRISIPFGPIGFNFISIFRSIMSKQNGKYVGHTDISQEV